MAAQIIDQLIVQANSGDPEACFNLYQEFRHGIHVAENDETAQEWLEKAIDYNHPKAMLIQEMDLLMHGYIDEAKDALKKQCEQGNSDAMNILGQLYLNNIKDVDTGSVDEEQGLELITQAACRDNTDAQILLGKCFYIGKWVQPDKFMARYWLDLARQSGSTQAKMLYDEACREVTPLN